MNTISYINKLVDQKVNTGMSFEEALAEARKETDEEVEKPED